MVVAGELLLKHLGEKKLPNLILHPSDTVRGWAAYMIACIPDISLSEILSLVRPLEA